MTHYLSVKEILPIIQEELSEYVGYNFLTTVDLDTIQLRHMPWSTLYFFHDYGLVIKIVHFPDQTTPNTSWESDELLKRGKREYNAMTTLHHTFMGTHFATIEPIAYIKQINALVMRYVDGVSLYDQYIYGIRWLRQQPALLNVAQQAGEWLARFHEISQQQDLRSQYPPYQEHTALNTVKTIKQFIETLKVQYDVTLTMPPLTAIPDEHPVVWVHGDFHMRNVLILKTEQILGFDTAFELTDSPAYDIGKFLADMKTRKQRLLSGGVLPPIKRIKQWEAAFLAGYNKTGSSSASMQLIWLYEGRFLLQKWCETLEILSKKKGASVWIPVVNQTFRQLYHQWVLDTL